ncbi:gluconate 2-dehydrogenase subunit 3 family protein [bacterium]|nr:MAG: gluconate 2-dehydrogenase subunit 3 family protein [bacterium]
MGELSRNAFLKLAGVAGTAGAVNNALGQPAPAEAAAKPPARELQAFTFLTPPEQRFVEAAIERLIPADSSGPGAREAGVAYYIDQQLRGAWGTGARQYRQGPWMAGTPEQGYQLNLIPQQVYRIGIAATNAHCRQAYGKTFDALSGAHQDDVLHGLESGKIALAEIPSKTFFSILLGNTIEGYFADPLYGGNRNMAGWRAVGFPGVAAAYAGVIEKYNVPYKVKPVSIADVEQGLDPDPGHAADEAHRQRIALMHARQQTEA